MIHQAAGLGWACDDRFDRIAQPVSFSEEVTVDKKTRNAYVSAKGTSFVNGELFTMTAKGKASVPDGTIEMAWELSDLPDGFSILTLIDSTSSGMSPIFALEENGGRNLLTLSGGNYRLSRTFDYGRYGAYDFTYEIRTTGTRVTSTGVQEGTLDLPTLEGADMSLVEILYPAGARELRSFMQATKTATGGRKIPLSVSGVYSPLDSASDWTRRARAQVRRSNVEIIKAASGNRLSLKYTTVITPIPIPEFPN